MELTGTGTKRHSLTPLHINSAQLVPEEDFAELLEQKVDVGVGVEQLPTWIHYIVLHPFLTHLSPTTYKSDQWQWLAKDNFQDW